MENQNLRQVRANLSEPEPKLRARLQDIYDCSTSTFVKENVAPFINMTPETFSGVYANAAKETHWLSYPNYAALVAGSTFKTDHLADGNVDIFINLYLKTLENHAGIARVIIGSFLNAIYNRDGDMRGHTLFLLDEVARLGYLRILETARDAGRKNGITLTMLYQSIGQDARSIWRARRDFEMVRERVLGFVCGRQRPGNGGLHIEKMRDNDSGGRSGVDKLQDVRFIANSLQAPVGETAYSAARSTSDARGRTDYFYSRQSAPPVRTSDLVQAQGYARIRG